MRRYFAFSTRGVLDEHTGLIHYLRADVGAVIPCELKYVTRIRRTDLRDGAPTCLACVALAVERWC